MNRERAKELLPIIEHFANGGAIQTRAFDEDSWADLRDQDGCPSFFDNLQYRIKPEAREFWINPDENTMLSEYESPSHLNPPERMKGWIKVREVLDD